MVEQLATLRHRVILLENAGVSEAEVRAKHLEEKLQSTKIWWENREKKLVKELQQLRNDSAISKESFRKVELERLRLTDPLTGQLLNEEVVNQWAERLNRCERIDLLHSLVDTSDLSMKNNAAAELKEANGHLNKSLADLSEKYFSLFKSKKIVDIRLKSENFKLAAAQRKIEHFQNEIEDSERRRALAQSRVETLESELGKTMEAKAKIESTMSANQERAETAEGRVASLSVKRQFNWLNIAKKSTGLTNSSEMQSPHACQNQNIESTVLTAEAAIKTFEKQVEIPKQKYCHVELQTEEICREAHKTNAVEDSHSLGVESRLARLVSNERQKIDRLTNEIEEERNKTSFVIDGMREEIRNYVKQYDAVLSELGNLKQLNQSLEEQNNILSDKHLTTGCWDKQLRNSMIVHREALQVEVSRLRAEVMAQNEALRIVERTNRITAKRLEEQELNLKIPASSNLSSSNNNSLFEIMSSSNRKRKKDESTEAGDALEFAGNDMAAQQLADFETLRLDYQRLQSQVTELERDSSHLLYANGRLLEDLERMREAVEEKNKLQSELETLRKSFESTNTSLVEANNRAEASECRCRELLLSLESSTDKCDEMSESLRQLENRHRTELRELTNGKIKFEVMCQNLQNEIVSSNKVCSGLQEKLAIKLNLETELLGKIDALQKSVLNTDELSTVSTVREMLVKSNENGRKYKKLYDQLREELEEERSMNKRAREVSSDDTHSKSNVEVHPPETSIEGFLSEGGFHPLKKCKKTIHASVTVVDQLPEDRLLPSKKAKTTNLQPANHNDSVLSTIDNLSNVPVVHENFGVTNACVPRAEEAHDNEPLVLGINSMPQMESPLIEICDRLESFDRVAAVEPHKTELHDGCDSAAYVIPSMTETLQNVDVNATNATEAAHTTDLVLPVTSMTEAGHAAAHMMATSMTAAANKGADAVVFLADTDDFAAEFLTPLAETANTDAPLANPDDSAAGASTSMIDTDYTDAFAANTGADAVVSIAHTDDSAADFLTPPAEIANTEVSLANADDSAAANTEADAVLYLADTDDLPADSPSSIAEVDNTEVSLVNADDSSADVSILIADAANTELCATNTEADAVLFRAETNDSAADLLTLKAETTNTGVFVINTGELAADASTSIKDATNTEANTDELAADVSSLMVEAASIEADVVASSAYPDDSAAEVLLNIKACGGCVADDIEAITEFIGVADDSLKVSNSQTAFTMDDHIEVESGTNRQIVDISQKKNLNMANTKNEVAHFIHEEDTNSNTSFTRSYEPDSPSNKIKINSVSKINESGKNIASNDSATKIDIAGDRNTIRDGLHPTSTSSVFKENIDLTPHAIRSNADNSQSEKIEINNFSHYEETEEIEDWNEEKNDTNKFNTDELGQEVSDVCLSTSCDIIKTKNGEPIIVDIGSRYLCDAEHFGEKNKNCMEETSEILEMNESVEEAVNVERIEANIITSNVEQHYPSDLQSEESVEKAGEDWMRRNNVDRNENHEINMQESAPNPARIDQTGIGVAEEEEVYESETGEEKSVCESDFILLDSALSQNQEDFNGALSKELQETSFRPFEKKRTDTNNSESNIISDSELDITKGNEFIDDIPLACTSSNFIQVDIMDVLEVKQLDSEEQHTLSEHDGEEKNAEETPSAKLSSNADESISTPTDSLKDRVTIGGCPETSNNAYTSNYSDVQESNAEQLNDTESQDTTVTDVIEQVIEDKESGTDISVPEETEHAEIQTEALAAKDAYCDNRARGEIPSAVSHSNDSLTNDFTIDGCPKTSEDASKVTYVSSEVQELDIQQMTETESQETTTVKNVIEQVTKEKESGTDTSVPEKTEYPENQTEVLAEGETAEGEPYCVIGASEAIPYAVSYSSHMQKDKVTIDACSKYSDVRESNIGGQLTETESQGTTTVTEVLKEVTEDKDSSTDTPVPEKKEHAENHTESLAERKTYCGIGATEPHAVIDREVTQDDGIDCQVKTMERSDENGDDDNNEHERTTRRVVMGNESSPVAATTVNDVNVLEDNDSDVTETEYEDVETNSGNEMVDVNCETPARSTSRVAGSGMDIDEEDDEDFDPMDDDQDTMNVD
eukprot:GHVL01023257.1.p1 GENE.GHVL01023257.1~~GHVL01023257.1.p1  ORF type:complete len:2325 (-),score=467.52 GHVL01023257.1:913-7185(-)